MFPRGTRRLPQSLVEQRRRVKQMLVVRMTVLLQCNTIPLPAITLVARTSDMQLTTGYALLNTAAPRPVESHSGARDNILVRPPLGKNFSFQNGAFWCTFSISE